MSSAAANGGAFRNRRTSASRPRSIEWAAAVRRGPAFSFAAASAPQPTASTKARSPHGPTAMPVSNGQVRSRCQPAMMSAISPSMPSDRATLFEVPSGSSARGTLRSG